MSECFLLDTQTVKAPLRPVSAALLHTVRSIEDVWFGLPQAHLETEHLFHAGVYSRTIRLKADMLMTNVLIKRSTLVIVQGSIAVLVDGSWERLDGYNVIPAAPNRKQMFATISDCMMTMIFATEAKTVAEAEAEFTDELESLASRRNGNDEYVCVTGG